VSTGQNPPEGRRPAVHIEYKIDLSNPTEEELEQIKSKVVENIARQVMEQKKRLQTGGIEEGIDHHTSYHNLQME